jgi:RNA polymerase sigma-70 factor (ECF subfamily)
MDQEDFTRLVARASAGDTGAFGQLITALEPDLRRYVTRLVSTRPVVDDVLQETFLRLWKGLSWLRDPLLFRPWSFRIATREAHRMLGRERRREAHTADPGALESIAVDFTDPSARLDIETHLPRVTPGARLVVVAHYFEGLSLDEIASATDLPLGTVKSRLASGLVQLRKQLGATR